MSFDKFLEDEIDRERNERKRPDIADALQELKDLLHRTSTPPEETKNNVC